MCVPVRGDAKNMGKLTLVVPHETWEAGVVHLLLVNNLASCFWFNFCWSRWNIKHFVNMLNFAIETTSSAILTRLIGRKKHLLRSSP